MESGDISPAARGSKRRNYVLETVALGSMLAGTLRLETILRVREAQTL
jgi:hypothetical protein